MTAARFDAARLGRAHDVAAVRGRRARLRALGEPVDDPAAVVTRG